MRKTFEQRFESKIDRSGDCWIWNGTVGKNGYGSFFRAGKTLSAHRVSYELANGPIPDRPGYHGSCVLHRCDVPRCVNPAHLFLGTQLDNMRDMMAKGRREPKTHCKNGHEFNPENTRAFTMKGGGVMRICKECNRRAAVRRYHRRKALAG